MLLPLHLSTLISKIGDKGFTRKGEYLVAYCRQTIHGLAYAPIPLGS